MDTSETYIKMCKEGYQIRDTWMPAIGDDIDHHLFPDVISNVKYCGSFTTVTGMKFNGYEEIRKVTWLPHQDQLQKMIGEFPYPFALLKFYLKKILYYDGKRPVYPLSIFRSGEQLWFAFVMHEKYQKEWNGSTWVDITEKRKEYTIRFPPEASEALEDMSEEEGVSAAELIRRAVNFYQVKMEAKKKHKRIILESEDGTMELVV